MYGPSTPLRLTDGYRKRVPTDTAHDRFATFLPPPLVSPTGNTRRPLYIIYNYSYERSLGGSTHRQPVRVQRAYRTRYLIGSTCFREGLERMHWHSHMATYVWLGYTTTRQWNRPASLFCYTTTPLVVHAAWSYFTTVMRRGAHCCQLTCD